MRQPTPTAGIATSPLRLSLRVAHIFEPLTLRDLTIKNRIWLAPMCQYSVDNQDGTPTDWHLVHLGSRATGGFGLILTEATAVTPEGRISPQDTGIWNDEQQVAWARIVSFVHEQDAAIGIQLAHAGRKASTYRGFPGEPTGSLPLDDGGWPTLSPSPVAFDGYVAPREMTLEDIADTVQAFATAARRADEAGFDIVEIHGAHGYLVHEFLSPLANHRTDGYGGDFDGRVRFLLETVHAVRQVWPAEKPLFVRLSATDWVDGGWDADQSVRLSVLLKQRGVDLVDVSTGGNVQADMPVGPSYQVPFARQIRAGAEVPSAAVGMILTPQQAEEIVAGGDADAILLARAALREPAWPLRAAAVLGLGWQDAPYPAAYGRGNWDNVPAAV